MSSSSSASSRLVNRRSVRGVPKRCWCGRNIRTYVSQTPENPFRRFFRCDVALQRRFEDHFFKWVDEALLDETRLVEENQLRLAEDVKNLKTLFAKMQEELKDRAEEMFKAEPIAGVEMVNKTIQKFAVSFLLVGGLACVCWSLLYSGAL